MMVSDPLTASSAADESSGHRRVAPGLTVGELSGAAVGGREFRAALSRFATGITVVTMLGTTPDGEERPFGITVNAFLSLSLDPPLVAVSIDKRARAHATLMGATRFGVSVLAADQAPVSDHFAGRPVEPVGVPYEEYDGFPVIRGAIAQLVLRAEQRFDVGDHTLFVGRVEALRYADGAPLVYFGSAYRRLPEP